MKPTIVRHEGYDLMPAAVDFFSKHETLGVKYETNPRDKWFTRQAKDAIHIFYYPDRTIYRMKPSTRHNCIPDVELDNYLDYSFFSNPKQWANMGYRYVMISPPHMGFKTVPIRNKHVRIFADSGGFQMRQGVTDFVDPDTLVAFYNETTDIGIGLDVPMHPLLYDKYLARMAHVTSRNNQYIKARLDPGVMLYDLNHGMDLQDRKIFMDVTEQYAPNDGIAMAGTSSKARGEYGVAAHLVNGVVGIGYVLDRAKKNYRTAHILGTTTPFYMFAFHYMTKSGFFPHITSDSSTYAQAAMMNTQLTSIPGTSILYRNTLPKGNVMYRSPCSCPVCAMVGYSQHIFVNARANMIHSLYHFGYLNSMISDLVDNYIAGHAKISEVESVLALKQLDSRYFRGTLAFMEDMCSSGFTKAFKKHDGFLGPLLGKSKTKPLFGQKIQAKIPAGDEKRVNMILDSYEKWQAKKGVKTPTAKSK